MSDNKNLRWLLWVAVSTKVQADEGRESLPDQERRLRAAVQQHSGRIVDVLIVPGHSRRYIDIHVLAADAAKEGIDAFQRLLEHFKAGDFDVLACLDADRFARTQSLHAYIVESVIELGARIYPLTGDWVDKQNFRMFISMSGYAASSAVDRLVASRNLAYHRRAQEGLPVSPTPLFGYKILRAENGRALGLIVDETKRRLFNDLATLLLEGVSLGRLEAELYNRFGHTHTNNRHFYSRFFVRILRSPTFWGHTRFSRGSETGNKIGAWIFDDSTPPPADVSMYYNTHESIYQGDLLDAIKAELRRRMEVRGRTSPKKPSLFAGLVVCSGCKRRMGVSNLTTNTPSYRCIDGQVSMYAKGDCPERATISERKVKKSVNAILRLLIERGLEGFTLNQEQNPLTEWSTRIDQAQSELAETELSLKRLIEKQATASIDIADIYDQQISVLAAQRKGLQNALREYERTKPNTFSTSQQLALDELRLMTLEKFWQMDNLRINQHLRRLFGKWRLYIEGREVVSIDSD